MGDEVAGCPHNALTGAFEALVRISGEAAGVREDEWDLQVLRSEIIDAFDHWVDLHRTKKLAVVARTSPIELYAEFPGQETTETPHEHRLGKVKRTVQGRGQ